MKPVAENPNLIPSLLILSLGMVFCLLAIHQPVGDYGNYYFGSKLALQPISAGEIYEPWRFNELIRLQPGMQHEKFFLNYAPVPPFSLFFYVPFTLFPLFISKLLFNLLSVLVFSASFSRLLAYYSIRSKLIWLLPFIFILPLKSNIFSGQSYLLMTAFLIEGFLADEKSRTWKASCWFALAIALKIVPVFVLLYLLMRRKMKTFTFTVISSLAFFLLGMCLAGWGSGVHYFTATLPRLFQNEINNPYAVNYQSVFVFLKTVFVRDTLLNPASPFDWPVCFEILQGTFTGLLFYVTVHVLYKSSGRLQAFSVALMFGLLATAYSSTYSLFLLVIPAVALLNEKELPRRNGLTALLFLICLVPVYALAELPLPMRFLRLYALLIFFIVFVIPSIKTVRWPWLFAFCFFFVSLRMSLAFFSEKDDSTYYLGREEALLIRDYHWEGNRLMLDYVNEYGLSQKSLACSDSVYPSPLLVLKNNQVFYNQKQITTGTDGKLKPALLNDSAIIYLSDKNRGVGFYTLRKKMLK